MLRYFTLFLFCIPSFCTYAASDSLRHKIDPTGYAYLLRDTTTIDTTQKSSGISTIHTEELRINPTRFAISCGILGVSITGVHFIQYNSWWKDQRGAFHIVDDPDYKANFDKFGHTFGGYFPCFFFDEAYTWSGFSREQSTLLATLSSVMFEMYVEIEDGFARDWGFSPGDALANIGGATFYLLRNRIPFVENFNYKLTYFPSSQLLSNRPDIPNQALNPIDDYGGQSYWITANINGLLPMEARGFVPDWLNLAVGIGGYNLDAPSFTDRKKAYYIGLDYDIDKMFPESEYAILNFIRKAFGYIHFPAPAYRISPDPRFFILFPFKMTIG